MRSDEPELPEPSHQTRPAYDRPGDSWMCGNPGVCPNGPKRNGCCPMADACQPKRTWSGKRRRVTFGILAVSVLLLGFALWPQASPSVFKPGELSSPHSQILSGTLTSARCAACHRSASISPVAWFNPQAEGHKDVSQTDRCLDCHHQTIDRDLAKMAHNIPPEARKAIRARMSLASSRSPGVTTQASWHDRMPSPSIDQNDVDCAACHREHQGVTANLLAVSDAQCQTCHVDRFGDFASSHPEWGQWPYQRGGNIAFDHRSHLTKHFPATVTNGKAATFDCSQCHQRTEQGEITRAVSFEVGCASCHNDALQIESAKGIELVALPTLPRSIVGSGAWPEAAIGPLDGKLPPLAMLLMQADKSAKSVRRVGGQDLSRMDPNVPQTARDLRATAAAHQRLLRDLADRGQVAISDRMSELGISAEAIEPVVRQLPAQLLIDAYYDWILSKHSGQAATPSLQADRIKQVGYEEDAKPTSHADLNASILLPLESDEEILFAAPQVAQLTRPLTNAKSDEADVSATQADNKRSETSVVDSLAEQLDVPQINAMQHNDEPKSELQTQTIIAQTEMDSLLERIPGVLGDQAQQLVDPLAVDPLAVDPLAVDPLAVDPLAVDPLAVDPLAADPLASDPLASDPLTNDPLSPRRSRGPVSVPSVKRPTRFDPTRLMPSGGWYRDPIRLSIAYRGTGHSDPVLRAMIELARRLSPTDPVRQQILAKRSITACTSCHQSATDIGGSWHSHALVGAKTEFTKFTHGPHLNISQLTDCQHCHQVNRESGSPLADSQAVQLAQFSQNAAETDAAETETADQDCEFLPLGKQACAACHTARAAGESCVKCHRYHIHQ